MPAAYCVVILPQVFGKGLRTERLNDVHALLVQLLDGLVDGAAGAIVVRVIEALAPMAKVGGYYKQIGGVHQVRGEE